MSDMNHSVAPKTDQVSYDHFISGKSITIKITGVDFTAGEQPVALKFENSNGKVFRPCKSMRRVLIAAWGDKASNYVGRSMTLYGDPTVRYGALEVGGVRISHLSHIDKELKVILTATKGNKKPYTVKPLVTTEQPAAVVESKETPSAQPKD